MAGTDGPLFTGGIPGPIAFGWVIDKACLLWQDQCGQQGSCFVYQNSAMSRYMLITGLAYKVREAAAGVPRALRVGALRGRELRASRQH